MCSIIDISFGALIFLHKFLTGQPNYYCATCLCFEYNNLLCFCLLVFFSPIFLFLLPLIPLSSSFFDVNVILIYWIKSFLDFLIMKEILDIEKFLEYMIKKSRVFLLVLYPVPISRKKPCLSLQTFYTYVQMYNLISYTILIILFM